MNNETKNEVISQEDIKRRKSAKISVFPEMNFFSKNLNDSGQSDSQVTRSPPLKFKSNSLFAYQELDKFSSFCDNESFPLDILTFLDESQNPNKASQNNNIINRSTKQEEYEGDKYTLTIQGSGSLNASSNGNGAGINACHL